MISRVFLVNVSTNYGRLITDLDRVVNYQISFKSSTVPSSIRVLLARHICNNRSIIKLNNSMLSDVGLYDYLVRGVLLPQQIPYSVVAFS